jgi:hypothetical protein
VQGYGSQVGTCDWAGSKVIELGAIIEGGVMPNIEGGVMANVKTGARDPRSRSIGGSEPFPRDIKLKFVSRFTVHDRDSDSDCGMGLAQSKFLSFKIFYHCDCAVHCNLSGY